MRKVDDARIGAVLEVRFETQARDFERKLVIAQGSLESFAVFATVQNQIGAQTFHRLARLIDGPDRSVTALVWAPLVRSWERAAFVTAARETVAEDFDIVETAPAGNFVVAPEREEYLPVLFTEVYRDRPDIAGLDILSLPERRIWIERARDAARPIATPPIRIFDRSGTRVALLVVWPVYSTAEIPAATEQRRKAFRGVAINQLQFDELFSAAIANESAIPEVIELLVDGLGDSGNARPAAVYDLSLHRFTVGPTSDVLPAGLTFTREFERLGRQWTLIAHFPAQAEASPRSTLPLMSIVLGLGLTAMLAAYTYHERSKRSAAEQVAAQRTTELAGVNQLLTVEVEERRRSEAQLQQNQQELKESERRHKAIFATAVDAIIVVDQHGIIQEFNKAAERMTGYLAAEVIGQNVTVLLPPHLRNEHHLQNARYLRSVRELEVCRKDATVFPADLAIARWWAGGHRHFTGIMRDLTSQKREQLERTRLEEQLHQAQKMEAIGNLTGGMAHDFNNVLAVIIGNIDMLRDLRKDDPATEELTREALDAAFRGADLTRRLLAFARQQPLRPQRVDINELVSGITKLLSRTLGEQVEISLDLASDAWPIVADPAQLQASLTNLATNARDAMPHGGRLMVRTGNRDLDADYAAEHAEVKPGDYVMIEVSDTGVGMTPDVMNRIFEPFFSTKERDKGTGLGLSMVFGFIKQSGGHVSVYSEPGKGTTFRLLLPRMTEDAGMVEPPRLPARLVRGRGEAILVVEDNPALRRVVVRQLMELGYRVQEAENAGIALRLMEGESIDLLLTDIVMPGGTDGHELAHQARQCWPNIRVVFTSGFSEARSSGDTSSLPPDMPLLSKPYRKEDLASAVRQALERAE
jgi:PAS domain S-box-containing protein